MQQLDISADELSSVMESVKADEVQELSDDELDNVSGGVTLGEYVRGAFEVIYLLYGSYKGDQKCIDILESRVPGCTGNIKKR